MEKLPAMEEKTAAGSTLSGGLGREIRFQPGSSGTPSPGEEVVSAVLAADSGAPLPPWGRSGREGGGGIGGAGAAAAAVAARREGAGVGGTLTPVPSPTRTPAARERGATTRRLAGK